ncbi:phosphotransferase family protein [Gordonia rubripertincta]|uniref:Phosphotransferase n=1 Tax=Gordonia rubripertincta TaxID=36822 RepID=A0ABT4MN14_GORRU|nr:phosphotransferase family protein [Gordonia rubripertincta]MCZ4548383.1 phosphotransferase [Gordonia rubripertincta]
MIDQSDMERRLAARLTEVSGHDTQVTDLVRLTGGANSETWSFVATTAGGARRLILRRQPGDPNGPLGMARESSVIAAAERAGIAVPKLVDFASADSTLGAQYLICEHIDGETIPRKLLRDERFAQARRGMAAQLGRTLAQIHAIPTDSVPELRTVPAGGVEDLRERYLELDVPSAVTEIALAWLTAHQPDPVAEAVVHGDFRNGNLIVAESGLAAVIDWELAHIGDPREDLGWLLVKCWRFGTEPEAGGFGSIDELLDGYAEVAGHRPDVDAVRWWQLYRTVWWSIGCAQMVARHLSGKERSVELATIGRRVCEQEHDALLLLGYPADPETPAPLPQNEADLHGRPTAAELVDAVAEFLRDSVVPGPDREVGFKARVAANALDIVGRELTIGKGQVQADRERFEALGFRSETDVALAIRTGKIAATDPAMTAAVRASVTDRLAVANPRYLAQ